MDYKFNHPKTKSGKRPDVVVTYGNEDNKVVGYTLSEFIEVMHESYFFQPFTQGELIVETERNYSDKLMEAYDEERFGY